MFKLSTIAFAVCGLVALAFVVDGAALSSMGNLHGALWWRILAVDASGPARNSCNPSPPPDAGYP
ncbi:MAG: hypothetical protein WCQ50_02620 [Spirochaetota bacterium]